MSAGASAVRLATSTLERCDLESRPAVVSATNEATVALSKVTKGRDPRHVEHAIAGMTGSPYSGALVRKYADGPIPLWTLLELVSFGPLTRLYHHCFGRAGTIDDPEERSMLSSYRGMLRCTQQLRHAAAHNDCLLNGLASHEKKSSAYPKIRRALVEDYGMNPDVVAQVGIREGRDGPCRRPHLLRRVRPEGRQPIEGGARSLGCTGPLRGARTLV
jgi:hypothetical protein